MTSNVTPIRPNGPKTRRARVRKDRFLLLEPPDGPSCVRLIQALHGVCQATKELAEHVNVDLIELGTAAEILSALLQERITDSRE